MAMSEGQKVIIMIFVVLIFIGITAIGVWWIVDEDPRHILDNVTLPPAPPRQQSYDPCDPPGQSLTGTVPSGNCPIPTPPPKETR
jgi:hypothetical protein